MLYTEEKSIALFNVQIPPASLKGKTEPSHNLLLNGSNSRFGGCRLMAVKESTMTYVPDGAAISFYR